MEKQCVPYEQFCLKFEGDTSIEAGLLGRAILDMSLLINEVAKSDEIAGKVELRVDAFRKGSFEVDFLVALDFLQTKLASVTISDILSFLSIIKTAFEIKKHIKGEPPKAVERREDHVAITLADGTFINAMPGSEIVLANKEVDRLISEISSIANAHNPQGGLSLSDRNGSISFSSDDVRDIALQQPFATPQDSTSTNIMRVVLSLGTVDFKGNSRWKFHFGKRPITASIEDNDFLLQLRSDAIGLHSGDRLDVDLETEFKLSPLGEVVSERHRVLKVHRHMPTQRVEQIEAGEP